MVFGTMIEQQKLQSYDIYTGVNVQKKGQESAKSSLSLEEIVRKQQEMILGKKIEKPVKRSTIMPVK